MSFVHREHLWNIKSSKSVSCETTPPRLCNHYKERWRLSVQLRGNLRQLCKEAALLLQGHNDSPSNQSMKGIPRHNKLLSRKKPTRTLEEWNDGKAALKNDFLAFPISHHSTIPFSVCPTIPSSQSTFSLTHHSILPFFAFFMGWLLSFRIAAGSCSSQAHNHQPQNRSL